MVKMIMASWKSLRRSWETFSTLCSGHGVGDGIELLVDTRLVVKMLREMKIIWRWCRCSIGTPTHQYLLWDTDGGFFISNDKKDRSVAIVLKWNFCTINNPLWNKLLKMLNLFNNFLTFLSSLEQTIAIVSALKRIPILRGFLSETSSNCCPLLDQRLMFFLLSWWVWGFLKF